MRCLAVSAVLIFVSSALSQDRIDGTDPFVVDPAGAGNPLFARRQVDPFVGDPQNHENDPSDPTGVPHLRIRNPFDPIPARQGMGMGMDMAGKRGQIGEDMGMMGMEAMQPGMGMDESDVMADMMGFAAGSSADQRFRRGLQRAIQALRVAQTDNEKEVLRRYIREAFEDRYIKMIADRRRDLEKLKQSVAKLENDLKRREAAQDRVVQVQLQSVQLAAEGLLELNDLQGPVGGPAGYGMGFGEMEDDGGF